MFKKLKYWMSKFDELPARERVGAFAAAVTLLLFVLDLALITPVEKNRKLFTQRADSQKLELATVTAEWHQVSQQLAKASPPREREVLDDLKRKIGDADSILGQMQSTNRQMGRVVQEVLQGTPGLKLVSLKTLPVAAMMESKGSAAGNPGAGAQKPPARPPVTLYRHGVELTVQGNYLAFLPYLEKVQSNSARIFWGDITMDVVAYPESVFKVTLYTFSEQPSAPLG